MVAAARHGLVPSLWVAALATACFNFFARLDTNGNDNSHDFVLNHIQHLTE